VPGIDESVEDSSLRTYVSHTGYAYRRIKHFSGYNLTAGRAEQAESREIAAEP
jgi:hypothetical protein